MSVQKTKVALISGGKGAVGQAVARALSERGYLIALFSRETCDLRDAAATAAAVQEIVHKLGRIDVCVHCAVDKIARQRVLDLTSDAFKSQFETGLFGAFNLFKPVIESMRAQKSGHLIGITSSVVEPGRGSARLGAYAVAKAALRGLLRELHRELSPDGIRVAAVAPDLMQTPLTGDLPPKYFEFAQAAQQGRPLMTPEDVARAVVFLCDGDGKTLGGISYLVASETITDL